MPIGVARHRDLTRSLGAAHLVVDQLEPLQIQLQGRYAGGSQTEHALAGHRSLAPVRSRQGLHRDGPLVEHRGYGQILEIKPRSGVAQLTARQLGLARGADVVDRAGQGAVGGHIARQGPIAARQKIPQGAHLARGGELSLQGFVAINGDSEGIGAGLGGKLRRQMRLQAHGVARIGLQRQKLILQPGFQMAVQHLADGGVAAARAGQLGLYFARQMRPAPVQIDASGDLADILVAQALQGDVADRALDLQRVALLGRIQVNLASGQGQSEGQTPIRLAQFCDHGGNQVEVGLADLALAGRELDLTAADAGIAPLALDLPGKGRRALGFQVEGQFIQGARARQSKMAYRAGDARQADILACQINQPLRVRCGVIDAQGPVHAAAGEEGALGRGDHQISR